MPRQRWGTSFALFFLCTLGFAGCDDEETNPGGDTGDAGDASDDRGGRDTSDDTADVVNDTTDTDDTDAADTDVVEDGDLGEDVADVSEDVEEEPDLPPPTYTIGGSAFNIVGDGVFLQNNGGDDLPVPEGHSTFTFAEALHEGDDYLITVEGLEGDDIDCIVDGGEGIVGTADVTDIVVSCVRLLNGPEPSYPNWAPEWNNYVNNDGGGPLATADEPCPEFPDGFQPCLHGGELRRVPLPWLTSCQGVTGYDSADAFTWQCAMTADGVELRSIGLAEGQGLTNLIDFTGEPAWRDISVRITHNGIDVAQTAETWWWDNGIVVANDEDEDGTEILNQPEAVYVVTEDAAATYVLAAPGVALVTAPDVTLTTTIEAGAFIGGDGPDRVWIEGDFDCSGAPYGIQLQNSELFTINNANVRNGGTYDILLFRASMGRVRDVALSAATTSPSGLYLEDGSNNEISRVQASGLQYGILAQLSADDNRFTDIDIEDSVVGLSIVSSRGNDVRHITTRNTSNTGVGTRGGTGNSFTNVTAIGPGDWGIVVESETADLWQDLVVSDMSSEGILLQDGDDTRVIDARVAHSDTGILVTLGSTGNFLYNISTLDSSQDGVRLQDGSHRNVVIGLTTSAADGDGLRVVNSNNNVFMDVTASDNADDCLSLQGALGTVLMNVVAANCQSGLRVIDSSLVTVVNVGAFGSDTGVVFDDSSVALYGLLATGGNTDDCDVPGADSGITDDCAEDGASDFTWVPDAAVGSLFVGQVGTNGDEDLTEDDVNPDDDDSPGTALAGDITEFVRFENPYRAWTDEAEEFADPEQRGACRGAEDTCRIFDWTRGADDEALSDVLSLPDPLDESTNYEIAHLWSDGSPTRFLSNAVELVSNANNGNGLCEALEDCLYTANLGSDHGRGNPLLRTTYDDFESPFNGALLHDLTLDFTVRSLRDPDLGSRNVPLLAPISLVDLRVVAANATGFWAQDAAGGDYSGIFIDTDGPPPPFAQPGTRVSATGLYTTDTAASVLLTSNAEVVYLTDELPRPARLVEPADLQPGSFEGDVVEGQLVRLEGVRVSRYLEGAIEGAPADAFWVTDDSDEDCLDPSPCALVVDDLLDGGDPDNDLPSAELGDVFESITGVVDGNSAAYRLMPRGLDDLVPAE